MLAEKFAKQNGIEWHEVISKEGELSTCSCGATGCIARFECEKNNPSFQHPEEVLVVCQKWDDWFDFVVSLCKGQALVYQQYSGAFIMATIFTTPGKLLEAAVEWREK